MSDAKSNSNSVAIKQLESFKINMMSVRNGLSGADIPPIKYYEYDEFVSKIDLYLYQYNNYNQNVKVIFDNLPFRPEDGKELRKAYDTMISIINNLSEQINANFEFAPNPKADENKIEISRTYLNNIKNTGSKIKDLEEKVELLGNNLVNAKNENLNDKSEKAKVLSNYDSSMAENARLRSIISDIEEEKTSQKAKIDFLESQASVVDAELKHFKEQAQRTEIARNSTNFHNQADSNRKTAIAWGFACVTAILIFIAFLFTAFSNDNELFSVATSIIKKADGIDKPLLSQLILIEILKKVGTRLLIFSVVVYLISFLVKNYNAQMHNYIVNSHKANALRSTVDLIGTAKQDDGNDKIILQATQAIFTTQKSGYQGAESEPSSPNLITNVVDAVSNAKKG